MNKHNSKLNNDDSKTIYSNRHINYLDVNGLCWYLFKTDSDKRFPSSRYINSVKGEELIKHLEKHAIVLSDSKVFDNDKNQNKTDPFNDIRFRMPFLDPDEEGASHLYLIEKTYENIKIEHPIIIKINFDRDNCFLAASSIDADTLHKVINDINEEFSKKTDYDKNTFFGILMNTGDGIEIKKLPIDDKFSKDLDINLNYGKGFEQHHKNIVEKLESNSNGIFMFHGGIGTGKTTYIKYLAKKFGGKRTFIFIPTTFIDTLTSPNIIPVLLEHPNSVLVLEDAEKAVVSREEGQGNESLVSSLLNIGDGILGSMLNLTIVLTFNTARDNVDKALLRKGRLHYEHAFEKLSIEDAQALVDKLNKSYKVKEPMNLAEIYNLESDNNHKEKERGKIGFGA
jgi:hypothetical protein